MNGSLSDNRIKPGAIMHIYCNFTKPPKYKFIIVVSVSDTKISFLFINSEINYNLNEENNAFRDSQVSIFNIKQYDFLSKYKSYIDCSNLHKLDYEEIFNQFENHVAEFKGTLEKDILKKIIEVANSCPLLPKVDKDTINKNFTPLSV